MSTGSLKSRIQHYLITKLIRELSVNVKVSPGSVSFNTGLQITAREK